MLPTPYQTFIHSSRYSRWLESENRRETWEETVARYFDFFEGHLKENCKYKLTKDLRKELETAVLNLEVMPSMRCLMTAGEALERDHVAGYNCSFVSTSKVRSFDEILYILMCLSGDTEVVTHNGTKKISEIDPDTDLLLTLNEAIQIFEWEQPLEVIESRVGSEEPIIELVMENGSTIQCTADHRFLTSNRGWVEAKDLDETDDLVTADHDGSVYNKAGSVPHNFSEK